eukprot:138928-Prymnesium_polylepis.1
MISSRNSSLVSCTSYSSLTLFVCVLPSHKSKALLPYYIGTENGVHALGALRKPKRGRNIATRRSTRVRVVIRGA